MVASRYARVTSTLIAILILLVSLGARAVAATDTQTRQALIDAINDEYHAHALYQAVIAKFGQVRPFSNIVRSEEHHIVLLKPLFEKYGVQVPANSFSGKVQAPATLSEACTISVKAEQDNIAIYERILKFVKEPEIVAVFTQLRDASANAHLRAFSRRAN